MKKNTLLGLVALSLSLPITVSSVYAEGEKKISFENAENVFTAMNQRIIVPQTPVPSFVRGVKNPLLNLDGEWWFNPKPSPDFEKKESVASSEGWVKMTVPSEWYMHSYQVEKDQWAGYFRDFDFPESWKGKRCVLRFGAVESECRVFINGKELGRHMGSMTQFEMDASDAVKEGKNTLALYVRSESVAENSSRISHYAKHQVGGILRSVELISLPQTHLSRLTSTAKLSDDLKKAELKVQFDTAGLGKQEVNQAVIILKKRGVEGISQKEEKVAEAKVSLSLEKNEATLTLDNPELWHAEYPYLYTLEVSLKDKEGITQTARKLVGFRKLEIRGNQILVNNLPVKLRGVARHDIHPYEGRAIPNKEFLERDIKLFRDGNCNFIRTSHYTPDEYLVELCDRYGIFLEDEAPVCWDRTQDTEERAEILLRAFKSMLMRDRDKPSIIQWSIANESVWAPRYVPCLKLARQETPDIPVKFSHSEYYGIQRDLDVGTKHYPGTEGLLKYDNYFRPIVFDEALHLNCYNTSENMTDPGLREFWGEYAKYFIDNMQDSPAIMGVGIWCGIDEMFYPKNQNPCGSGPWGLLDGFRREKPEYWHMKMAYSPVQVVNKHFQTQNGQTLVALENRYNSLNMKDLDIVWKDGADTGTVKTDVAPGEQGTLIIPRKMKGDTLHLTFRDKRGYTVSEWELPRQYVSTYSLPSLESRAKITVSRDKDETLIQSGKVTFRFSDKTGMPLSVAKDGKIVVLGESKMYAIPLLKENEVIDFIPQDNSGHMAQFTSDPLKDWKMNKMTCETTDHLAKITTSGTYGDVPVTFIYQMNGSGRLRVDFNINLSNLKYEYRQIGIGFDLPREFDKLRWKRRSLWNYYPDDHIGRPEGEALAFYPETALNYYAQRETPKHTWNKDGNAFGSNDFRSTKQNLVTGELSTAKGDKVTIESNGHQHFRSWIMPDRTRFLLAGYSCGGNEHYLSYDSKRTRYNLKDESGEFPGWLQIQF